jgi:predicted enzyme related to lactoylglutathione lyase
MIDCHGRFVWYELMTTDVAAAKAFYTRVVGWGTKDAFTPHQPHTLFTVGSTFAGAVTGLPEDVRKTGATPMWIGYVGVTDVDATVDRTKRLGGAVRVPPTNVLDISRLSIVTDPQMAMLAVIQWAGTSCSLLIPRRHSPFMANFSTGGRRRPIATLLAHIIYSLSEGRPSAACLPNLLWRASPTGFTTLTSATLMRLPSA